MTRAEPDARAAVEHSGGRSCARYGCRILGRHAVLDQLERCEQTIDLVAGSVLPALARTPAPAIVSPGWKPIKG